MPLILCNAAALLSARHRGAMGVAAAVLASHALLLGLWPDAPGSGWLGDRARPLQVRQIVQPAPVAASPARAQPETAPVTVGTPAANATIARAAPAPARRSAPAAVAVAVAAQPAPAAPAPERPAQPATPEPGGADVPVYATRLAPAIVLHYELRRGAATGRAELRWQPGASPSEDTPADTAAEARKDTLEPRPEDSVAGQRNYALTLRAQLDGAPAVTWASLGVIDAHGVAPERYTESRRGREQRAVNFQREAGRITFSGPQLQYPWVSGAQDRLSWMVQLAAVLAADPLRAEPGAEVALFVTGTRGDAEVWRFVVIGAEAIELPSGPLPRALHLRREPRRPYDTLVEVWLDPARHHLPVRAQLSVRPTGEGSEFLLRSVSGP